MKHITIGVACDGFRLTAEDEQGKKISVWVDQEDDPSIELKKFFKQFGITVKIEQEY